MNRKNMILGALLAVQTVLVIIFYWPEKGGQAPAVTLTDIDPSSVTELRIEDGYNATITLTRKGDNWFIDPPENFPADAAKVKDTLGRIAHLSSSRLVSRSKGSYGRLRVSPEKFNRHLTITHGDGKALDLYLGNAQGRGVYARRGDSDEVVFIDKLSFWSFATSPRSWWKTRVVDLGPGALKSVAISNGNGSFVISRSQDGNWTGESGAELDQARVEELLGSLEKLHVSEYLKKDSGEKIDKPAATLRLVPDRGDPVTLIIGSGKDEKSDRLVSVSTGSHLIKVRGGDVADILSASIEGLLKPHAPGGNETKASPGSGNNATEAQE